MLTTEFFTTRLSANRPASSFIAQIFELIYTAKQPEILMFKELIQNVKQLFTGQFIYTSRGRKCKRYFKDGDIIKEILLFL